MKKIFCIIAILIIVSYLPAENRTLSDARTVSENFLQIKGRQFSIISENVIQDQDTSLYIFNLSEGGFIITAADDMFYPVVAYSWLGCYAPETSNDLQFIFIKEDQSRRKEYYLNNPGLISANQQSWNDLISGARPLRTFQQWPMDGNTMTDGWCDTQWSQTGVFNSFCPLDNTGNRSVVGCVATAMAQIMHFHQYLGNPVFNNSDDYSSGWWDAIHIDNDHEENDFPDWNELNDYLDVAAQHYADGSLLTEEDLAALSYACGVSVEMSYSSDGSGANTEDVAYALTGKFDYDTALWSDNNGGSFYTNIANNMKQMQPCEFSIYTSGWNDGHAIVCDGYNTDNYYHLNYGWGSSNIGWYYIPAGMPSNYSIIGGAVRNIEGGELPVAVNGEISGPALLEGCHVFFAGEKYCYEAYTDENGEFSVPAVKTGWYTVSAVSSRIWYAEQDVYIISDNQSIILDMFNYDALDGHVTAGMQTGGSYIALYQDNQLLATTIADLNGYFSFPDILPGLYLATASLSPDFFGSNSVTVSQQNQFVPIILEEFPYDYEISWAGVPQETHSLVPIEISLAIKISPEDLIGHENDVFYGVTFICPITEDEGSIAAQLWRENELLVEQPIGDFSYGEEVFTEFPFFSLVEANTEYFIGYKVETDTGVIAWRDAGPRVPGKGAWFRISSWVEMSAGFDFNFCIKADLIGPFVDAQEDTAPMPAADHFSACFPNPYNQSLQRNPVNLMFQLAQNADTQIALFNIKGQKVAQILNSDMSAGDHQISWQPQDLSSGIYFYQLSVNGKSADFQKTIFIK